jgi:hypothetical protein
MAVAAPLIYVPTKKLILTGGLALGTTALASVLLTSSYTPNGNTDATWANCSAAEVATANGYTQGGNVLGSVTAGSYGLSSLSSIGNGGTAYAQSDVGKTVTLSGGTFTVAATVTITQVNGGSGTGPVTGIAVPAGGGDSIGTPGIYSVLPTSPVATTGGGTTGSGLTIAAQWGPVLTAANPSWTAGASPGITAKYLGIVAGTAGALASTNPLLLSMDLYSGGGSVTATGAAFTVTLPNGILFVYG